MKELLVPVGSMDSLIVAIKSGADAVYLGGKKFGARAFATNFDDEEMVQAIKMTHLYGVKIYVTVNTLVYESELDEVLDYVTFLHKNGVDAVIMQDIGLISKVRDMLPNLEIHASTQVHNTNEDGLKLLEELGVKRVVLARELSLDEIKGINTSLEKEVFIHGALCVAYSGQCLFSSLIMDRSGNRGACAGMCRLPFSLICNDTKIRTDGEYLLSTKELNTAPNFRDILESDVVSLKIEGRMKSPEYVGCVTRLYRDLIDKYNDGKEVIPDLEILEDLKVIFNREYTLGYINNARNHELMNIKSPNHVGIPLGSVIDVNNKYIKIKLSHCLKQGDGIRFNNINEGMIVNFIYSRDGKLIKEAKKNEVIMVDKKYPVKIGESVNKTLDVNVIDKYINGDFKRIEIDMKLSVLDDKSLCLEISDGINIVNDIYGVIENAKNAPITIERIKEQLSKLGNTPFKVNNTDIRIPDRVFINIKDLNELRRRVVDKLIGLRENKDIEVIINRNSEKEYLKSKDIRGISVLCRSEEHILAALKMNVERIYVIDKNLYNKYRAYNNVYFRTYRVNDKTSNLDNVLSTELGALRRLGGILDYSLNITNHETINYYSKYADLQTLSVELSFDEVKRIMSYYHGNANLEVVLYGNIELMITKYCPLNLNVKKGSKCNVCLSQNKYYLRDRNGKDYRILTDVDIHLAHILNYKPINLIDKAAYYKEIGINNFRIELLDESQEEAIQLISQLSEVINE